MPNMVIPLSSRIPHCPLTTNNQVAFLPTVSHKTKALPRKNEVATVEAVFNVLETLSSSRLLSVLASVT